MLPRRKILTAICVIMVPGSILATVGYALHLRSGAYRRGIESAVGQRLGMSVSIGTVRPLTPTSTALQNVHVYLENGMREVFACDRAMWRVRSNAPRGASPGADQRARPDGETFALDLIDGWLLVAAVGWTPSQYQRMLEGGLGHDFDTLGLAEIRLDGIDLRFQHALAEFSADSTTGVVYFDDSGDGRASLSCHRLNGIDVTEPVNISLRFTPGESLAFHEVRLSVPPLPLVALGLGELLGGDVSRGVFDGVITYRRMPDGDTVDLRGSLREADLQELTARAPGGPYRGSLDVDVDSATFVARELRSLALHGRVADLLLGEFLPGFSGASRDAFLSLQIDQMRWDRGRLAYLSARGEIPDLSLGALTSSWDVGSITGHAAIDIASLLIVDDRLVYADVEITVQPPADAPGLIDHALVAMVAKQWVGVDLSIALPDQIEYAQLGARLVVEDGRLRVFGTHGSDGRTILTIKVFGQSLGVLRQPSRTFEVPDVLALLRERAGTVDVDSVKRWWEKLHIAEPEAEGP